MMETLYNIHLEDGVLKIGFGSPSSNDKIVVAAQAALEELKLQGGDLLKISGPASLPVAFVLAHGVAHLYGAIAIFDPKLGKYVVSVSHSKSYPLGTLID